MTRPTRIALLAALFFTALASAQVVCPTGFPAQNPVPSNSPEDIPPTNIDIITYTGATTPIRANHNISYVEVTPNDQRVWFGVDSYPGLRRIFYNRRVRDDANSPWRWLYSYSPAVITFPIQSSTLTSAVLYSETPRYLVQSTNTFYKFLMYIVYQPSTCDGGVGGFLYYALSDDGICWTEPRPAVRTEGGPEFNCHPVNNPVPIIQAAAIDRPNSSIALVLMEGNGAELAPGDRMARAEAMFKTKTHLSYASPSAPGNLYRNSPVTDLSAQGLFLPIGGPVIPGDTWPDRYQPYAYMMNLQIAYDAASGDFYVGRGYPYPYDRYESGNTPTFNQTINTFLTGPHGQSAVEGCEPSPATFPNRIQIYRMNIGSLDNIATITTGTWSLVLDSGGPLGFAFNTWSGGPVQSAQTPLVSGQSNGGRDYASVSFLRDRTGNLVRYGSTAYYFAGDTFKLSKGSNLPCRITGLERNTLLALP